MAFILFVSEYLQDNLKKRHLISTMYPSVISTNVPSVFVASSLMVCKLNLEPKSDCLVLHIMGASNWNSIKNTFGLKNSIKAGVLMLVTLQMSLKFLALLFNVSTTGYTVLPLIAGEQCTKLFNALLALE